jgi:anaerobic selenocysteine-containing dehydrogenase
VRACITLNLKGTKALALKDGEPAIVSSKAGQTELRVHCSDIVARGVALSNKGHRPKLDAAETNVNVLNSGERTDMGENSSVHGTLVRIAAA